MDLRLPEHSLVLCWLCRSSRCTHVHSDHVRSDCVPNQVSYRVPYVQPHQVPYPCSNCLPYHNTHHLPYASANFVPDL